MVKPILLFRLAAAMAVMAVWVVSARAQEVGRLRDYDANGDHAISISEATTAYKAMFAELDANHDGQISQKEYVDAHLARLSRLDANHDGKVDRSEMRSAVRARLGR